MNLNQVTVPARDLSVSVPFYQRLGLELIVYTGPHYARFVCPEGGATFSLHQQEVLPMGEGVTVYFECADLDERVAQLRAQGVSFTLLPTDQRWRWREAHLQDPDGNRLILYFAGENRLNPPWRIGGESDGKG